MRWTVMLALGLLACASPATSQSPVVDSSRTYKVTRTYQADSVATWLTTHDTVKAPTDSLYCSGSPCVWSKTKPQPPDTTVTTACVRTIPVTTAAALVNAASSAQPGDCIKAAAGSYTFATQSWTKSGTATKPITLEGVGSTTKLSPGSGGAIYVRGNYWTIRKLRVTDAFYAIQTEGCTGCVLDSIEADHTANHAIGLFYGTNHTTVKNSKVHDSGTSTPKWGEGVYIGGYSCSGCSTADNAADDNAVVNSQFWNTGAEAIDVSAGADRATIIGNTIDGAGTASISGQTNSLIDLRGTGHVVSANVLTKGAPYGIDVYEGGTFHRNTITGATLGIRVLGGSPLISCDNQSTSNKACTP